MNFLHTIKLTVVLTLLVISFSFAEGGPDPVVAVVTKTVNSVKVKAGNGGFNDAKVGQTLVNSNEVKTGDKSLALIKFTDNSILRVRDNSSVVIYASVNGQTVSKNTQINSGQVGFNVTKQEDKDFKFTTPTMVASIRGTGGVIGTTKEGNGFLAVDEGQVDVDATLGAKGKGSVRAGFYVIVGTDGVVDVQPFNDEIKQRVEGAKRTNTQKMKIQTSDGDLIIEYFVD